MRNNELTSDQMEIMQEFYSFPAARVEFDMSDRKRWWDIAKSKSKDFDFEMFKEKCPAFEHQVRKSYESDRNIQSAVFSECVYCQTIADMMGMSVFVNYLEEGAEKIVPDNIINLLRENSIRPRYFYLTPDGDRMLVQAGGHLGPDSAIIDVKKLRIHKIEMKEPGSKSSEYDLPKYANDGSMVITQKFIDEHPQYKMMLNEAKDLNFFNIKGSNYKKFSKESVVYALDNNYSDENNHAGVVCTEDLDGYLVMIPSNETSKWADSVEGEIRPAGRNNYKVWTIEALKKFIKDKKGIINGNNVKMKKSKLGIRAQRGGNGRISGYKINELFFIRIGDCEEKNGIVTFDFEKIRQLKPTIAGKMGFGNIKYDRVKKYYGL